MFNKSELYNFTFDFFSQDELIQVEQAIIKPEPLWFSKMFPHQFKMDSLRNQTMITPPA